MMFFWRGVAVLDLELSVTSDQNFRHVPTHLSNINFRSIEPAEKMSYSQVFPVGGQAAQHQQHSSMCIIRHGLIDDCARGRLLYAWSKYYFMTSGVDADQPCSCPISECRAHFANATALFEHLERCKQFENEKMWCPGCSTSHTYSRVSKDQCSWTRDRPGRTAWERLTKSKSKSKHDPKSTASLKLAGEMMEQRLPVCGQVEADCPYSPESAYRGFSRDASPSYELQGGDDTLSLQQYGRPDHYRRVELGETSTSAYPQGHVRNKAAHVMENNETTGKIPIMSSSSSSRVAFQQSTLDPDTHDWTHANFNFTGPTRQTHSVTLNVSPASSSTGTLDSLRNSTTSSFPDTHDNDLASRAEMAGDDIFPWSEILAPRSTSPAPMEIDSAQADSAVARSGSAYTQFKRERPRYGRCAQISRPKPRHQNNDFSAPSSPVTARTRIAHCFQGLPTPNSSRQNSGDSAVQMAAAATTPFHNGTGKHGHEQNQHQRQEDSPKSSFCFPRQPQHLAGFTEDTALHENTICPRLLASNEHCQSQAIEESALDESAFTDTMFDFSNQAPWSPIQLTQEYNPLMPAAHQMDKNEQQFPEREHADHVPVQSVPNIVVPCPNHTSDQCAYTIQHSEHDSLAKTRVMKNLRRHVQRKHKTTGRRWQCDKCRESFSRPDNLKKHQRTIHMDRFVEVSAKSLTSGSPAFQEASLVSHDAIEVATRTTSPLSLDDSMYESLGS